MTAEIDVLSGDGSVQELAAGVSVRVLPLKTRQLFRMMKIVTRGAGGFLMQYPLDWDDEDALGSQFLAIVLMAVPEAEDETIEFVRSVVEPADIETVVGKPSEVRNQARRDALDEALANPELDDLLTIIETVIGQERENLSMLGKRLRGLMNVAMGQAAAQPVPVAAQPAPKPRRRKPKAPAAGPEAPQEALQEASQASST